MRVLGARGFGEGGQRPEELHHSPAPGGPSGSCPFAGDWSSFVGPPSRGTGFTLEGSGAASRGTGFALEGSGAASGGTGFPLKRSSTASRGLGGTPSLRGAAPPGCGAGGRP